jgi:hypothetical protein
MGTVTVLPNVKSLTGAQTARFLGTPGDVALVTDGKGGVSDLYYFAVPDYHFCGVPTGGAASIDTAAVQLAKINAGLTVPKRLAAALAQVTAAGG